ncbi:MAG: hypothetical protein ABI605_12915 [Rhizobacter sp.]
MTTIRIDQRLSPHEYAVVVDAAHQRAMKLRREAFDGMWAAMARGLRAVWRAAHKRQSRLAARS